MKAHPTISNPRLLVFVWGLACVLAVGAFLSSCTARPPAVAPPAILKFAAKFPKPPARPKVVAASLGNVTIGWNLTPPDAGYRIYSGPASRVYQYSNDVGAVSAATVPLYSQTNFLAVTGYNQVGESAYSLEVSYVLPAPPVTPTVYRLYAEWSTNVSGPWSPVPGFVPLQVTNTAATSFFRLRIQ